MGFKKHEEWRRKLWKAMRQEPTFASESAPGIADILEADVKIWCLLAEKTLIAGVQIKAGQRPLEKALDEVLVMEEVKNILCVRPRGERALARDAVVEPKPKGPKKNNAATGSSADSKASRKLDNAQRQIVNLNKKLQEKEKGGGDGNRGGGRGYGNGTKGGGRGNKGGGKRKGKGKGNKRKFVPMPKALIGLDPTDENDENICFDCNLPCGCDKAKWGEKCPKGWHKCMKRGCKKHHSYVGNHWGQPPERKVCPHSFGASGAPFPQPTLSASDEYLATPDEFKGERAPRSFGVPDDLLRGFGRLSQELAACARVARHGRRRAASTGARRMMTPPLHRRRLGPAGQPRWTRRRDSGKPPPDAAATCGPPTRISYGNPRPNGALHQQTRVLRR